MFTHVRINENIYKIQGRGCDCYLLLGKQEAIMIDSGCDSNNIQKYAQKLTHLPVKKVINTHSHFDHTGGNGFFEEVYMTVKQSYSAKNWMDEDPNTSPLDYDFIPIKEGKFAFDGRFLLILDLDCHSPGNVALLDSVNRVLFTGDEIDADQVLLLPGFSEKIGQYHSVPSATVNDYKNMLLKLKKYENNYDLLCTGHNGSPLGKEYIDNFITLCDDILENKKGSSDVSSPTYSPRDTHYPFENAHYLRAEKKGCALVYCSDDYYDRSNNNQIIPATPLHIMCEENMHRKKKGNQ